MIRVERDSGHGMVPLPLKVIHLLCRIVRFKTLERKIQATTNRHLTASPQNCCQCVNNSIIKSYLPKQDLVYTFQYWLVTDTIFVLQTHDAIRANLAKHFFIKHSPLSIVLQSKSFWEFIDTKTCSNKFHHKSTFINRLCTAFVTK